MIWPPTTRKNECLLLIPNPGRASSALPCFLVGNHLGATTQQFGGLSRKRG
jgi:hypothetical protein